MVRTRLSVGHANRATSAAKWAFYWAVAFVALHIYWYLGGRVGFGDIADPLPGPPTSVGGWIFTVGVHGMFAAGLVVPLALTRPWGRRLPRSLLVWSMWIGCAVLVIRGGVGLLDDFLRMTGIAERGLTGLSNERLLGAAQPSAYTWWSTVAVDSVFLVGGVLFGRAAWLASRRESGPAGRPGVCRPDLTILLAEGELRRTSRHAGVQLVLAVMTSSQVRDDGLRSMS